MGTPRREAWSTALAALGAVLLLTAGLGLTTVRGVLDPDQFANRLAASLGDDGVARWVADRLTDVVLEQKPDLVAVRPVIHSTMTGIVHSEAFRGVVRTAARVTHRAVLERKGRDVILSLPDLGILLRGALEQASPALAAKVPVDLAGRLATGEAERRAATVVRLIGWGEQARTVTLVAFWLGAALIAAAIAVARDRRRGLVRAGLALVAVGLACAAWTHAGRIGATLLLDDPALAGMAQGVWRAFFGNLRLAGLALTGAGLLLASMGSAAFRDADPVLRARELLGALSRTPARPLARFARALVLVAAGAASVSWPAQVATLVAVAVGLALALVGLRELSALASPGPGSPGAEAAQPGRRSRWPLWAGAVACGLAATAGLALLLRGSPADLAPAGLPAACNGSARLCDRPLDRVVFPGAHNAMSNAEVAGWMFPHHLHGLRHQLEDGVRALLLDVHYGIPTGGAVKTDLGVEVQWREKIEDAVGPEGTAAAMRIRDRLVGGEDAKRGIYFCHGFCELGAYQVGPVLRSIREFLVGNPGEVVLLVVEDYVSPEDLERVFAESGLAELAYPGSTRAWPTLRALVAAGHQLVVFTESGRPGAPWLHPAFESFQETPYRFLAPAEMSCRPNRGGTGAPLFLVNHWIETTPAPRPSNAATVNAYDFLLARLRRCQRERGRLPNVVAVDFYDTGDLLRVVRTLNGVGER